ncbi:MAG: hypothetical protein AMXMBFR33_05500 [Candidatus Xenobia bacterium]
MQREAEVLRALLDVSRIIASNYPMPDVIKRITTKLRGILKADECSIMILDESQQHLAFVESSGLTRWELDNIRFRVGEGVAGWVARHKKPVVIPRLSEDPRFMPVKEQKRPMISMICVPLIIKQRLIGVVTLTTRHEDHIFSQEDLELTVLLSAHVSLMLENNRLYEISVLDGLTNLYNRRYMEQRLDKELSYARRFHHPLSFFMVDIDWFKKLNDTYGHQAGDAVLRIVSELFTKALREYDIVARYGGEEFAVILPSTPRSKAASIAERLRASVAEEDVSHQHQLIPVSVSVGVATYPEDGQSSEALIAKADRALYRAKRSGRNRVVLADDD